MTELGILKRFNKNNLSNRRLTIPYYVSDTIFYLGDKVLSLKRYSAQNLVQGFEGRLSRLFEEVNSQNLSEPFTDELTTLYLDHIIITKGSEIRTKNDKYIIPPKYISKEKARTNILLNGSELKEESGIRVWIPKHVYSLNFDIVNETVFGEQDLDPITGFIKKSGPKGRGFSLWIQHGIRYIRLDWNYNVDDCNNPENLGESRLATHNKDLFINLVKQGKLRDFDGKVYTTSR